MEYCCHCSYAQCFRPVLNPGDLAVGFTLKNVDDSEVSLSDYMDQKGVIVVFTCNPCPFANAYEQRIIQLHNKYADQGFPVIAINPNDEKLSPEDSMEKMKIRAEEKEYPFPYLKDECRSFQSLWCHAHTTYLPPGEGGK